MPCNAAEWGDRSTHESGSCAPTRSLDWTARQVKDLSAEVAQPEAGDLALLQRAHRLIAKRVRPVYALSDLQPASRTLRLGRGSCSQRFAVLEAVARANGMPTRTHGLVIDGRFWYPRFPQLRWAVPDVVLLAWPEFWVDGTWVSASGLFGLVGAPADTQPFSNRGGETLFDAVSRTAVDWDGTTSTASHCSLCDMSANVLQDLGTFESRDAMFAATGQTFCPPALLLLDPILGRWSAGAGLSEFRV